ncbi:MAG TPA: nitroreductase [Alphaproteobacteria bacterium]|nr:nitroreductase [Alphaproteobacteria bacterium]HNS44880.1 nitroreductase [Alphaproteobacteria bacterium]
MNTVIDFLKTRRSVKIPNLVEPGPSHNQIEEMLKIASRIPDHGKLAPWRFIVFEGDSRKAAGELLKKAYAAEHPDEKDEERLNFEVRKFTLAPLVIAVVSSIKDGKPEWEQILSAGVACYNLELAAAAMGFSSDWLTEWYSYSDAFHDLMGLAPNERFAGFINIGTAAKKPAERERPSLDQIVTYWKS